MSQVIYSCAHCGQDCELPFAPKSDRPVYCRDCYESSRARAPRPAIARKVAPRSAPVVKAQLPDVSSMDARDLQLLHAIIAAILADRAAR